MRSFSTHVAPFVAVLLLASMALPCSGLGGQTGSSCTSNTDCDSNICIASRCFAASGTACTRNIDCFSISCKSGVCCNASRHSELDRSCTSCDAANNGACTACGEAYKFFNGTCLKGVGLSCRKASECASNICSASRRCRAPHGSTCGGNSDCLSLSCKSGVCCNGYVPLCTACDAANNGTCSACQTNYEVSNGTCLKSVGSSCSKASECASNICAFRKCSTADGGACNISADCSSLSCKYGVCCNGYVLGCAACDAANNGTCKECEPGRYLASGWCQEKNEAGRRCDGPSACLSGLCSDNVCKQAPGQTCGDESVCVAGSRCLGGVCCATTGVASQCARCKAGLGECDGACISGYTWTGGTCVSQTVQPATTPVDSTNATTNSSSGVARPLLALVLELTGNFTDAMLNTTAKAASVKNSVAAGIASVLGIPPDSIAVVNATVVDGLLVVNFTVAMPEAIGTVGTNGTNSSLAGLNGTSEAGAASVVSDLQAAVQNTTRVGELFSELESSTGVSTVIGNVQNAPTPAPQPPSPPLLGGGDTNCNWVCIVLIIVAAVVLTTAVTCFVVRLRMGSSPSSPGAKTANEPIEEEAEVEVTSGSDGTGSESSAA